MKKVTIGILAHVDAGKTTLTEAMLYAAGHVDRQGKVEDGSATTDYDPEEIKRGISISASITAWRMALSVSARSCFSVMSEMKT